MAAQIEYDDSGSTTFYFILSIYLLVLLPVSYFLLPKKKKQKEDGGYKGALCIRGQYNHDTVVLVFVQYLNRNAQRRAVPDHFTLPTILYTQSRVTHGMIRSS